MNKGHEFFDKKLSVSNSGKIKFLLKTDLTIL